MSGERERGRANAARLRAEQGLETPLTDPAVLRRLAAILDDGQPQDHTAPRRRRTASAVRRRLGTSAAT